MKELIGKIKKACDFKSLIGSPKGDMVKVVDENRKALEVIRENALKYGDPESNVQIIDYCNHLEEYMKQYESKAMKNQQFYKRQMVKDRVDRAMLGLALKNYENEKMRALADVLVDSINKRADYFNDEIMINKFIGEINDQQRNAKSSEDIKALTSSAKNLIDLKNKREENRPTSFETKPVEKPSMEVKPEIKEQQVEKDEPVFLPQPFEEEQHETEMKEENVKRKVLTLNRPNNQM